MEIFHQFFKIFSGIDSHELARLNQGKKDRCSLGSALRVRTVPSLSADDWIPQQPLMGIVIDGYICMPQEERKFSVVIEKICTGLPHSVADQIAARA